MVKSSSHRRAFLLYLFNWRVRSFYLTNMEGKMGLRSMVDKDMVSAVKSHFLVSLQTNLR